MEQFAERELIALKQIDARVQGAKDGLMGKARCRYTFEEIACKRIADLHQKVYKKTYPCDNWVKREFYYNGVGDYDYIDKEFVPIKVGENWGNKWVSCFFKTQIVIPEEFDGEKVCLQIFLGGDSLLSVNGVPYQGLDPFRNSVCLTNCAKKGEVFDIDIESYCYFTPGAGIEGNGIRTLECSSLVAIDKEIDKIYWDYMVAYNVLTIPDIDKGLYAHVRSALDEAMKYVDLENPDKLLPKLRIGEKILKEQIFENDRFQNAGQVDLIGHSHLDIIYLWEYKEFIRKVGRTHATMLRLLDDNPDFIFSQSQAVTYREMRDNFPALYEQVKKYVKEGRWEIIGAMWVEPDCNIISGESFVRQILLGKKFFKEEFGVVPKTCWLPDVFGNSYGMPQILAKSGIDYFVSHKPCVWNDTNPIAKHNFWWKGPDGSKVLAVLPPTHFVGTAEPNHIMKCWNLYSDKDKVGECMYCYGWGDGGGGVSQDMIENARRLGGTVGVPGMKMTKAEDCLDNIKEKAHDLPVLQDEIYLEGHRGVHTTHARLKKLNRRSENLLREAEMFSAIAQKYGYKYPAKEIEKAWETLLTNQFHDIIPGTHVKEAYACILEEFKSVVAVAEKIKEDALKVISENIKANLDGKVLAVYNSLEHSVDNLVYLDDVNVAVTDENGNNVPVQVVEDFAGNRKAVFYAKNIPAVGYKLYSVKEAAAKATDAPIVSELENDFFRISFNDKAEITSIYDKREERETLKGNANVFKMYLDNPSNHDAWDIIEEFESRPVDLEDAKIVACEKGDVFTALTIEKNMLSSKLRQKIVIYNELDRIDFITNIDWKEDMKLLKVNFPIEVAASKYTSDIAYATIERNIQNYNSFDQAKFEVNAHNWIDLSEEGYGVSILNDGKYGYSVDDDKIAISLLKAPMYPDSTCDREVHDFTYSLYPHSENWKRGGTVDKARALNNPATVQEINGKGNCEAVSFIESNMENVTVETVKLAEDGSGVIVRLLENCGRGCSAQIKMYSEIKSIVECDLMENTIGEAAFDGDKILAKLGAYEIKTYKVTF